MPQLWTDNKLAVTLEELVPRFWNSKETVRSIIRRHRNKPYGLKKLSIGGNGRQLLIDFDSLPEDIKQELGDMRKPGIGLSPYYEKQREVVAYYATYQRAGISRLTEQEQKKYVVNASVLFATLVLKAERTRTQKAMNKGKVKRDLQQTLWQDAMQFQDTMLEKYGEQHSLPTSYRHFKRVLKEFENAEKLEDKLFILIKDPHGVGKQGRRKVDERVLKVLQGLSQENGLKLDATSVSKTYDSFLSGYIEVFDPETGELFNPKEFQKLSESTVKAYLNSYQHNAGGLAKRMGDRQRFINQFIPHAQMEIPEYAGSVISIDDRQPPFWYEKGKRVWFYVGVDVASQCITCFVHAKDKKQLIKPFYRQMVRNYESWGLPLPYELECETSLNSSFKDTFLNDGEMFQKVHMEANNARRKYIERIFGKLRYELENRRFGWIARPFAKSERNQAGKGKTPILSYETIINNCLKDIETFNNMPCPQDPSMSRWQYFLKKQHPKLTPTNYTSFLPYLGKKTSSSCQAGYIKLQGKKRPLAQGGVILTGKPLIQKLLLLEGKDVELYWLDGNDGEVIKAMVFLNNKYICDIQEMPKFKRGELETSDSDLTAKQIQMAYIGTVTDYLKQAEKQVGEVGVIRPAEEEPTEGQFKIEGLSRYISTPLEDLEVKVVEEAYDNEDDEHYMNNPSTGINHATWQDKFLAK